MHSKVPLQGAELEEFLQKERAVQEKEAAQKAAQARTQRILEADEGEDESDDEDSDGESDEENEVEQTLQDDLMDVDDEPVSGRRKRRAGKGGAGEGKDWIDDDEPAQKLSFDIYLKGNVAKATSFFKSEGQTQRFRMFPFVEKKRRVDEYGETIDVGMWLRKGKVLEEDAESEEVKEARRRAEEEANVCDTLGRLTIGSVAHGSLQKAPAEPPSKYIKREVDVQLACRLFFVDMEGLNDGRAVKTIVPQVNPRKMVRSSSLTAQFMRVFIGAQIIVHAPSAATDALIESCQAIRAMTRDIYAPEQGDNVQIGQHTNSFSISLSDELLASIKISQVGGNRTRPVLQLMLIHRSSRTTRSVM